ncbi:MAG: hypothetical protein LBF22_13150 [Deltaproteobacteria bacterium]|nr:hypothetical protein [Deltaproteobacteria bacterium]
MSFFLVFLSAVERGEKYGLVDIFSLFPKYPLGEITKTFRNALSQKLACRVYLRAGWTLRKAPR